MPGWTLVDTHPTQGRTFQRPLGVAEDGFFLDGLFNGTADTLRHVELRLLNGVRDADIFSEANIVRAWISTKRRYPLAGAIVRRQRQDLRVGTDSKAEEVDEDSSNAELALEPHFIVKESNLSALRPDEIVFGQVADAAETEQRVAAILNGPRPLSDELLMRLYVFREIGSEKARADILHVLVLIAHCVTDGTVSRTLLRCLVDTLARGGGSGYEPAQLPLEDRLAMAIPAEELQPMHLRAISPARQRWRRAVAVVIAKLRIAKRKGGHTLPCRLTPSTPYTAALSGLVEVSLTQAQSSAVVAKCRQHRVTFGCAFLALAQVAMTRVLYRRYLRGEISEEEWTYRKRQPHINAGSLNLRPYLDKAWFERGGGGEFVQSIGFFYYQLPFMTLGGTDREHDTKQALSDDAPSFSDLLTFDRFLHRAELVKKQAAAFFNHPLFLEIIHATSLLYREDQRLGALQWMKRVATANRNGDHGDPVLTVADSRVTFAHGGSSLGNTDLILPFEYPITPTHALSPYSSVAHPSRAGYYVAPSPSTSPDIEGGANPTVMVESLRSHLHMRPGELYLGAVTWRGQLSMYIWYDGNVFEEKVVREWLDEVKGAVLWYLG